MISVEDGEAVHGPQMLPGGDSVLFTLRPSGTTSWDASQIVVQSLGSRERTVLIEGGRDARYVPTGHLVYALEGTLLAQAFDLDQLAMRGDPSRSLRASRLLRWRLARRSLVCRAMGHWSMCPAATVLKEVSLASSGSIVRDKRSSSTSPLPHI